MALLPEARADRRSPAAGLALKIEDGGSHAGYVGRVRGGAAPGRRRSTGAALHELGHYHPDLLDPHGERRRRGRAEFELAPVCELA